MFSVLLLSSTVSASPHKRDTGSNDSSGLPPQIWVPILILALVLIFASILVWSKKSLRAALGHISQGAAAVSGTTPPAGTRELTAEQLAGTINSADASRPRRGRRTRRTPSQISTTSLPVYMKEPGNEEVVIFRSPLDMEDVPIPEQAAEYLTMPTTPHDMPLLNNDDDSIDLSTQPLQPPGEGMPVRQGTDPRGPTPSYFEVVDLNEDTSPRSIPGLSTDVSRPVTGHHASPSTSSSFLNYLRRKKSTASVNNLSSPSTLSVNSISAPLTHTLQKTEFTYPRSGPTPEQVKLISSRESIIKFGRPYGADAVAFAASTSRHELPPPDFELTPLRIETSVSAPLSPIVSATTPENTRPLSMASSSTFATAPEE